MGILRKKNKPTEYRRIGKISDAGLDRLERHADEIGNVNVILMVMIIREIRELKLMLQQSSNGCDGSDDASNSADDGNA